MKNLFVQNQRDDMTAVPLPNPGEGGAVFPGNEGGMSQGGQSPQGPGSQMPGSQMPGSQGPQIPLPNPGEGGAVFPGSQNNRPGGLNFPAIIGTIITSFPRPGTPCRFCQDQNQKAGTLRMLNAAAGYNPFRVYVNDREFVDSLNFSELTSYEKVPAGYQIVTVLGENNYIYLQKPVMIPQDGAVTVAICNAETGLDLFVIEDSSCNKINYLSCLRVCNLAYPSGPFNVIIGNNDLRFSDVGFREVTNFRTLAPASYLFYVINSNRNLLLTSELMVKRSVSYTMYLLSWNNASPDAVTAIVVEER